MAKRTGDPSRGKYRSIAMDRLRLVSPVESRNVRRACDSACGSRASEASPHTAAAPCRSSHATPRSRKTVGTGLAGRRTLLSFVDRDLFFQGRGFVAANGAQPWAFITFRRPLTPRDAFDRRTTGARPR